MRDVSYAKPDDEAPPSMGVREPRKPKPPTLTGGARAELVYAPEPEAEAVAAAACVGASCPEPRGE